MTDTKRPDWNLQTIVADWFTRRHDMPKKSSPKKSREAQDAIDRASGITRKPAPGDNPLFADVPAVRLFRAECKRMEAAKERLAKIAEAQGDGVLIDKEMSSLEIDCALEGHKRFKAARAARNRPLERPDRHAEQK